MLELLTEIKNDWDHYKNKAYVLNIIENIDKKTNTIDLINNIINKIDDIELDDYKYKYILKFVELNKKRYIMKKNLDNSILYEYEDFYKWYPKNNIRNIKNTFETIFKTLDYEACKIDNEILEFEKWSETHLNEIKNAKKIEFLIKKKK